MSCEDCGLLQYNAVEEKAEHKYRFKGKISALQIDNHDIMYVITLKGEFHVYNIKNYRKLADLPQYECEYH